MKNYYELRIGDLDVVVGGISKCAEAAATTAVLGTMANIMQLAGQDGSANYINGIAVGFASGTCPGK